MPVNEYIYVLCGECCEKFFMNENDLLLDEMNICPNCGSRNIEKEISVFTDLTGGFMENEEEVNNGSL